MPNVLDKIKEHICVAYDRIACAVARIAVPDCRTTQSATSLRGQGSGSSSVGSAGLSVLAPERRGSSCLAGFRKWSGGLALCGLLLAESAIGATARYVTTSGSATWAQATNSGTPASLATANANAVAGDNIFMSAGSYGTGIAPVNAGTAGNRIVFMGATGDSVAVIVPSVVLDNKDYVTVKWLRVAGSVTMGAIANGSTLFYPWPGDPTMGVYDSLYFCAVTGGLALNGSEYATVSNCRIGTKFGSSVIKFGDLLEHTTYLTMNDCRTYGGTNSSVTWRADGLQNSTFLRNRHHGYIYGSSGSLMGTALFRSPNNTFTDCRWDTRTDNATVNNYQLNMRDTTRFNVFLRDTFYVDTTGTGGRLQWDPGTSGCCGKVDYNEFRHSVVHNNGYFRMQVASNGMVFDHCQLVLGRMNFGFNNSAYFEDPDSLTFTHNTVVIQDQSNSTNNFLWDNGESALFTGRTVFKNNIIVLRRHTSTQAMVVMNPSTSGGGTVDWNYNLYYSYATPLDSTRFLNFAGANRGFPMSTSSWCNTLGYDCQARFGDPGFADISAYDYTPSPTGNAVGGWWPDGYVGAISSAGADVTAPDNVSDLAVDGNSHFSLDLVWTAPGDDGATGTATSYDIRYSTGTITDANWSSATQATGEPTPQVAGSAEAYTLNGVVPNTTYYVAIKTSDEVGNISALSNIASSPTIEDSDPPTAVPDLTVSSPTTTQLRITWEAPEDAVWGTVTSYDLRRSTATINDGNWASATQLTGEPTPQANPNEEAFVDAGLSPSTTYYYAVKSADGSGNISALSNVASGTTSSPPDVTGPSPVDLGVDCADASSFCLNWLAPTDPEEGTATSYDIRYSTSPIDEGNWASASQFTGEPTPASPDTYEAWQTTGTLLAGTRYYLALKSYDSVGNASALSSVPNEFTTGSPIANGVTLGTITIYPNFNTASVYLPYSGDANNNSSARLFIKAGAEASTDTLYEVLPLDTLRSEHEFVGSIFWLNEGTQYTIAVSVSDPDGGSQVLTKTFTTRTSVPSLSTQATRYYVAAWGAGSDSAAGTASAPFRTMAKAWSVMTPGTGMVLKAGMHVDSLKTVAADSGTVSAPKYILGEAGAYLSGEDVAYAVTTNWDSVTISGQKMYYKTGFPTYPRVVVFGDSMSLFRHPTPKSLLNDSLGTTGNMQYGWARSKTNDTLFVQLEGGASPIGYRAHIASRTYMLGINSNNVVIDGVGVRYAGTDWRTDYYGNAGIAIGVVHILNAKNVTVRNALFLNNGWNAIVADSSSLPVRDITLERNTFRDTRVEGWGLFASSTLYQHPVIFMGSGRGGVVRHNTYRGFMDGGFRVDELTPKKFADFDFHGNDLVGWVRNADAVEIDACDCTNLRVWENRARSGGQFSDTEVYRGPVYYLYNTASNLSDGWLLRGAVVDSTFGPVHLYHNSFVSNAIGASGIVGVSGRPANGWHGANNLFVSNARPIDDANGIFRPSAWSLNYNYWVGDQPPKVFGQTYTWADSQAYRTNTGWDANSRFTAHGVGAAFADTANGNLHPVASSPAIDRGRRVHGVNFVFGAIRHTRATPTIGSVEYDNLRPAPIADLFVTGKTNSTVTLRWSASGDDSLLGRANNVVVKYSTAPITEGNFAAASSSASPITVEPGSFQFAIVSGLSQDTMYYFAVRTVDDIGQESALSNTPATILQAVHFPARRSFLNNLIRILIGR